MARSAFKLTIEEVAEQAGLHPTTVQRAELDHPRPRPLHKRTVEQLARFYQRLGVIFAEGIVGGVRQFGVFVPSPYADSQPGAAAPAVDSD